MQSIRNVFAAFANLAASINSLAAVIDTAAGKLRQQLALETTEVIEHQAVGEDSGDSGPHANGRSKRKAAAV